MGRGDLVDRWPTPFPASARVRREPARKKMRAQAETKMHDFVHALDAGESLVPFMSRQDRVIVHATGNHEYGFDPAVLQFVVVSQIRKWFAVLMTDAASGHAHSSIVVATNPYEEAAHMSTAVGRGQKRPERKWMCRSFIGPFDSRAAAEAVAAIWKKRRSSSRLEGTAEEAAACNKHHWFGSVADFEQNKT